MVEFREIDELEDDEEDLRVQIRERRLTEEERDQLLREVQTEVDSILDEKEKPHVIFSNATKPLKITNKESFEDLGYQFRPGIVDDRQYVWIQEKNSLLSAFGNQYFYFTRMQDLNRIFEEAASHLELGSMVTAVHHIYELSKQFTQINREFITKDNPRIPGTSLHLLCDIAGISIDQLEGRIAKISGANGHGGIRNPKFPVGDDLESLKARLIGIAVSDCHIPKVGSLHLTEGSLDRINRVKKILDNFGSTYSSGSVSKRKGDYEFYIASPIARALNNWGIPSGDRTILNYGLPDEFRLWSTVAKCGYMQEMLAQEGNVDKNGVINWSRSHAIFDGKKGPALGFNSRISQESLEFLKHSREMYKHRGIVTEQSIPIGRLDSLKDNNDNHISTIANELSSVVAQYRNKLIDNENEISTIIGIGISLKPVRISYFEKSNRASIRWQARIHGYESKIRSALIIRPNFDVKEQAILDWLSKQNVDDVKQSKTQLKSEGFFIQE